MRYVALLRGINVGGNKKIEMSQLRQVLEREGCIDVSTYINSGNAIFDDERSAEVLTPMIEQAILDEFGLSVPVIVKSSEHIRQICRTVPDSWTNDQDQRTDVLLLWNEVDRPSIVDDLAHKPDIENVIYVPGAVIWNIARQDVTRGNLAKLIGTSLYKKMTIRNINTVRKLSQLMSNDPV